MLKSAKALKDALRAYGERSHGKLKALAESMDIAPQTIYKLASDKVGDPQLSTIEKIAAHMDPPAEPWELIKPPGPEEKPSEMDLEQALHVLSRTFGAKLGALTPARLELLSAAAALAASAIEDAKLGGISTLLRQTALASEPSEGQELDDEPEQLRRPKR